MGRTVKGNSNHSSSGRVPRKSAITNIPLPGLWQDNPGIALMVLPRSRNACKTHPDHGDLFDILPKDPGHRVLVELGALRHAACLLVTLHSGWLVVKYPVWNEKSPSLYSLNPMTQWMILVRLSRVPGIDGIRGIPSIVVAQTLLSAPVIYAA